MNTDFQAIKKFVPFFRPAHTYPQMEPTDDSTLLRLYAEENSHEAFGALVARHVNLVYSVALRHAGDPHQAEEITQAVFIILAKKAAPLRHDRALSSWLFQAANLTAKNVIRSEIRRRHREQEAYMRSVLNEPESNLWGQIAPLLDHAVGSLNEKERRAIVLRFYEGRKLSEVGAALATSEDAAKKCVARAVEKLRKFFLKRGIASTSAAIMGAISANSVHAAPAALAKSVTAVAVTKGATASTSTLASIKGVLKVMAWTKAKTAILAGVATILVAGTVATLVVEQGHHLPPITDFPRSSWADAGYADPVSAFQTALWACSRGDGQAAIASCSLRMQLDTTVKVGKQLKAQGKSPSQEELFADVGSRLVNGVTGFRIVDQKIVSDNQVVLSLRFEGRGDKQRASLRKIAGEWKIDDLR